MSYETKTTTFALPALEIFSALAMMNLQNVYLRKSGREMLDSLSKICPGRSSEEIIAELAVRQAKALIAELEKEEK